MAVSIEIALPGQLEADVLGIPVAEPVERLTGDGAHIVDEKLGGRLQRLAQTGDLRGGVGETLVLYTEGELRAPRVVLAGVGPRDRLDADALCTAAAASVQEAPAGTVMWLLDEPLLIVLRYDPPRSSGSDAVLGLVGKAITFDSGGLSIKPAKSMEGMKGDMAGGGAVIEGTGAIAALGLEVRTIAVVAACENVI